MKYKPYSPNIFTSYSKHEQKHFYKKNFQKILMIYLFCRPEYYFTDQHFLIVHCFKVGQNASFHFLLLIHVHTKQKIKFQFEHDSGL